MVFLPLVADVADLYNPCRAAGKGESGVGEAVIHAFVIDLAKGARLIFSVG
jgi:hypothetical protein